MTGIPAPVRKPRKMTNKAAFKEAVRRWGKNASVTYRPKHRDPEAHYRVGKIELGMFFNVLGQGTSWEEAFAAAEAKLKRYGAA